jgi:hypothetical protein
MSTYVLSRSTNICGMYWVNKCLVDEFTGQWVYGLTSLRVDEFTGWQVYGSTNLRVDEFTGRQVYRSTNLRVDEFTGRQVYGSTSLRVDEFTGQQVYVASCTKDPMIVENILLTQLVVVRQLTWIRIKFIFNKWSFRPIRIFVFFLGGRNQSKKILPWSDLEDLPETGSWNIRHCLNKTKS